MSGSIRIMPAGADDAANLADLHALCFEQAWNREAIEAILAMPGAFGLVAEWPQGDGAIYLGLVLARAIAGEAEILTIGVAPAARRAGLGLTLMNAAIVQAAAQDATVLFLEVAEDNEAAIGLYGMRGFVRVGRRPGYYARGGDDVAALTLRLDLA